MRQRSRRCPRWNDHSPRCANPTTLIGPDEGFTGPFSGHLATLRFCSPECLAAFVAHRAALDTSRAREAEEFEQQRQRLAARDKAEAERRAALSPEERAREDRAALVAAGCRTERPSGDGTLRLFGPDYD